MAQANIARRNGDDFQARLFWWNAVCLLDPRSPIIKVAYETGPKSFDDIQVDYDRQRPMTDGKGQVIYRRHFQSKWHTTAGTFGYEDLADPDFINAQRFSFLQRAHQAQLKHAPDGVGCQFALVTNWRIKSDDPLITLVRKENDAFDLDVLFEGKTDRGRMGQVRKRWCEHLAVDHAGLNLLARTVAIRETPTSLDSLREDLDYRFAAVGMKRFPASQSVFPYDDLIVKLLAKGRVEFDRDSFREMARSEGILEDDKVQIENVPTVGVRSFMHPIDYLEDRCDRMLDLVPYFDGRYIHDEKDWQEKIYPELRDFVIDAARSTERFRLILDAHVSLAFSVGSVLNVKSGKTIEIEQRTGGRRFWSMDDVPADASWQKLILEDELLNDAGQEIAISVALTHDISPAVRNFVSQSLPQVGRIIHCRPESGPSQQSVRCGRHAWMLAEAVVKHLQSLRSQGKGVSKAHIFIAGPNGFGFFLGQHQQAIGPAALYEWDFDGQRGGGYSLGVSLPPVRRT